MLLPVNAPEFIDDNPGYVSELISKTELCLPSALTTLEAGKAATSMTVIDIVDRDFSLTRQLHEVLHPRKNSDPVTPAMVFLTANSAEPMKYTIQQFSEKAGIMLPTCSIPVHQELSEEFFVYAESFPDRSADEPEWVEGLVTNARKCIANVDNGANDNVAVVIDQYTNTGKTSLLASYIALRAGFSKVYTIHGFWYEQTSHETSNLDSYEKLFRSIGDLVFEGYRTLAQ